VDTLRGYGVPHESYIEILGLTSLGTVPVAMARGSLAHALHGAKGLRGLRSWFIRRGFAFGASPNTLRVQKVWWPELLKSAVPLFRKAGSKQITKLQLSKIIYNSHTTNKHVNPIMNVKEMEMGPVGCWVADRPIGQQRVDRCCRSWQVVADRLNERWLAAAAAPRGLPRGLRPTNGW